MKRRGASLASRGMPGIYGGARATYCRLCRWREGIASMAWSDVGSEADERGEEWTLSMQCGHKKTPEERLHQARAAACASARPY